MHFVVADTDCLHLLLERDVVAMIVKMMENLPSHSSAQQVCLQHVYYTCILPFILVDIKLQLHAGHTINNELWVSEDQEFFLVQNKYEHYITT